MMSCHPSSEEGVEYVVYKQGMNNLCLSPIVKDVRWVPLETSEDVLIGGNPTLCITEENIFIIDDNGSGKIFRFDHSGKFLNTIGAVDLAMYETVLRNRYRNVLQVLGLISNLIFS